MKRAFGRLLFLLIGMVASGRVATLVAAPETSGAPPPLAFVYHDNWWSHDSFSADATTYRTVAGDFNGDEQDDIAMLYRTDATTVTFYVILSNGDHFEWSGSWSQQSGYLTADMMTGRVVAGDFNNDGLDDVAAFAGNSATFAYVFLSNGSGFSGFVWWNGAVGYQDGITGRVVAGDFDGDGWKDDIAVLYDEGGGANTRLDVFISDGSDFSAPQIWWSSTAFWASNKTYRVVAGDFNKDGRDDVAAIYDYGSNTTRALVMLSAGGSISQVSSWWLHTGYNAASAAGRVVAGDFDGDGDDDIVLFYGYTSTHMRAHLLLSNRQAFAYQGNDPGWWEHLSYAPSYATGRVVAGDWDGDGVDDVSMIYRTSASSARAQVLKATALPPGPALTRQVDNGDPACNDSSGAPYCTIQAAVYAANDGDTIALAAGTYTERVTLPRYDNAGFDQALTVAGAGADQTIVDGSAGGRVVAVYSGGDVQLRRLTIRNGQVATGNGAGVFNEGRLELHEVTITGNAAAGGNGGGIASVSNLQLFRSRVSGNTAQEGGGIYSTGVLSLEESYVDANIATVSGSVANGGGVRTAGSGLTTVESSTIYNNFANGNGGGISQTGSGSTFVHNSTISSNGAGAGGGLHNFGSILAVANSTVAHNFASVFGQGVRTFDGGTTYFELTIIAQAGNDNCSNNNDGSNTVSYGWNLSTDQTCSLTHPDDLPGQEPLLGPLQDNGGRTFTHALAEVSPAVDGGSEHCGGTSQDQRGMARPQDGDGDGTALCDMGAFEYGWWAQYLPVVVRP